MPADMVACLVDDDVVFGVQQVGGRQAGMPVPMIAILTKLVFERRGACGSVDGAREPCAEERGAARERARADPPVAWGYRRRRRGGDPVDGVREDSAEQPRGIAVVRRRQPRGRLRSTMSRPPSQRVSSGRRRALAPTQPRAIGPGAASRATPKRTRPAPNAIARLEGAHRATLTSPSTVGCHENARCHRPARQPDRAGPRGPRAARLHQPRPAADLGAPTSPR